MPAKALDKLNSLDVALTGIGAGGIIPPLRAGDNFFTNAQVAQARKLGAVGRTEPANHRRGRHTRANRLR
jgi:hypothetical protein